MKQPKKSARLAKKDSVITVPAVQEDLSDKIKKDLKIAPYGSNIIIDKRQLSKLQDLFLDLKEYTVPEEIYEMLIKHMNEIRNCLGLITFEEYEDNRRNMFSNTFQPTFVSYKCKCIKKRKRE